MSHTHYVRCFPWLILISLPLHVGCSALVHAELDGKSQGTDAGVDVDDAGTSQDAGTSDDASNPSDASPDDASPDDASSPDGADSLDDAGSTEDAGEVINVLLPSNGGRLEHFTSEYCDPEDLPDDCALGYWDHTNIHDGEYAYGVSPTAFRASWGSTDKEGDSAPESFVFSFQGGASARLERIVIQNYGEEWGSGPYYSSDFQVFGKEEGSSSWSLLMASPLQATESPQEFDLVKLIGGPVVLHKIKLTITAGVSDDYWDLGEFEAWGQVI